MDKKEHIFNLMPPKGVVYKDYIKGFSFFLTMLQRIVWDHTATYQPDTLTISPCLWPIVRMQDGWEEAEGQPENTAMKVIGRLAWHGLAVFVDVKVAPGGYLDYRAEDWSMSCSERAEFRINFKTDFKAAIDEEVRRDKMESHGTDLEMRRKRLLSLLNAIVKLPGGDEIYRVLGCLPVLKVTDEEALALEDGFPEIGIKEEAGQCYITVANLLATITAVLCDRRLTFQMGACSKPNSQCPDCNDRLGEGCREND